MIGAMKKKMRKYEKKVVYADELCKGDVVLYYDTSYIIIDIFINSNGKTTLLTRVEDDSYPIEQVVSIPELAKNARIYKKIYIDIFFEDASEGPIMEEWQSLVDCSSPENCRT
jgi:hypothetical protein